VEAKEVRRERVSEGERKGGREMEGGREGERKGRTVL
jgi:hypothetical protein